MLTELVLRNRSYRRFHQQRPVDPETLRQLVDLARQTASAANLQPLKYILSWEPRRNKLIFPHLAWAAYLKDWPGPEPGEQPAAYIVILCDSRIARSADWDVGIAAQTILLGATERGLGGCMIGSIRKKALRRDLAIPDYLEISLVIALGFPKEKVVLEEVGEDGDIRYWRDAAGVHHVPKRRLDDIILA